MFPLFASADTSAAHDTTDNCSELIGFTSTRTCSSPHQQCWFLFQNKLIHCKIKMAT